MGELRDPAQRCRLVAELEEVSWFCAVAASREKNRLFEIIHEREVPANVRAPEVIPAFPVFRQVLAFEHEIVVLKIYPFKLEIKKPFYPFDAHLCEKRTVRLCVGGFQIYLFAALPALEAFPVEDISCLEEIFLGKVDKEIIYEHEYDPQTF